MAKRDILSRRKIFRQINSLVKPLLSRNFCQNRVRENRNFHSAVSVNFRYLHIVAFWGFYNHLKKFREINSQHDWIRFISYLDNKRFDFMKVMVLYNYENEYAIFRKNFVKLNCIGLICFHEIFLKREFYRFPHCVLESCSATVWN